MAFGQGPSGLASPSGNISGFNVRQAPLYSNEQQALFNSLLGGAGPGARQGVNYLSQLASGSPEAFAQAEAPAYSAFQRGIDSLAKRFAGVGALGSSGFRNAAAGAASELAENLGARRQNIQMQSIMDLLGLSQNLLSARPHETLLEPKKPTYGDIFKGVLTKLLGAF